MTQYIDKNALVAEIEKIKSKVDDGSSYCNGWQHALRKLEIKINTLEVKEVDLEKEIDNYLNPIEAWQIQKEPFSSMEKIARHFFELGLKAQKGE